MIVFVNISKHLHIPLTSEKSNFVDITDFYWDGFTKFRDTREKRKHAGCPASKYIGITYLNIEPF